MAIPEHLRALAERFAAAGWSEADVVYALDHHPSGQAWSHGDPHDEQVAVRRLGAWLDGHGHPMASREQQMQAQRERLQLQQRLAEAERARIAAQALPASAQMLAAERARRALLEASPRAARIQAEAAVRRGRANPAGRGGKGDDKQRWRRADTAAEQTLSQAEQARQSMRNRNFDQDAGEGPQVDAAELERQARYVRARRRARQERATSKGPAEPRESTT